MPSLEDKWPTEKGEGIRTQCYHPNRGCEGVCERTQVCGTGDCWDKLCVTCRAGEMVGTDA